MQFRPPLDNKWPFADQKTTKMELTSKERNLNIENMVFRPTESEFLVEKSIIDQPCPPNWPLVDRKNLENYQNVEKA